MSDQTADKITLYLAAGVFGTVLIFGIREREIFSILISSIALVGILMEMIWHPGFFR
jgi:hypothetical protein